MRNEISGLYGWVPVIGMVLLAAILFYGMWKNSRQSRSEIERSERGAKELREQLDREGEDAQSPH